MSETPDCLEKAHAKPTSSGFPVVGVGASAGGLEAIVELLSNLPATYGMALLVVQHLDPDHSSMLTDILAKRTAMPVRESADNQLIEKDQVYVIPPNTSMTVTGGRLMLKSRESIPGIPTPIDNLFFSLAEDQGANAIGISLSGSGSDGALGIQAIKDEGGITFAQNDASARFNSMPRAAVSLGCVDFILSPAEIAVELVRMGQHPIMTNHPLLVGVEQVAADKLRLSEIFRILNETCNHDFSHYKRGTLTRRLTRRVALLNLNSLDEYIRLLKENPDEVQTLYQDLLIRVTRFFRDAEAFEGLTQVVFPALVENLSPEDAIRIWVPGCSTGEEVYSIAICLMEFMGERQRNNKVQIFGTDVSESALTIARAGSYFKSIANEVSEARLERFFSEANGRYQVAKSLRDICVFANQNVTCDPPFSQLDLISCRNVLIYFDPALQKRVISLFHYALKPGGYLLLGPSETIGSSSSDIFTLMHNKKYNLFIKRPVPPRSHLEYLSVGDKLQPAPESVNQKASTPAPTEHTEKQTFGIDQVALARYVPAGVLCDDELNIMEFRGDTSPYLLQPSGPPTANLRQLARLGLFVEISSMIEQGRKKGVPLRRTAQRIDMPDGKREVELEVIPVTQAMDSPLFLVFFDPPGFGERATSRLPNVWARLRSGFLSIRGGAEDNGDVVQRLQRELDATREYMRTMTDEHHHAQEELKSSQEELLSSNEEFQITNEELETAKEELQSSNQELITTNDELLHRNDELNRLNIELEHARNYAQAIVETMHEPLVVLDENLRIVRTNAAFYGTFKLTPGETVGCLFYELDSQQWDIPELRQLLSEVLPKDRAFENCEITSEFSQIGERTMVLNGKHLAWDSQTFILLAIEDITDFKAAQNALKEAARRKDEFLAMLAHELRNPLAPIRNAMEIWRRGNAGKEAEQQAQAVMDRQLRKEARLIDDLLDIARITKGSVVLAEELVDLRQIATQAVESTQHEYEACNHTLELELPEAEVIVEGDTVRLEQVVSNLLTNAAKYTPPGGHIRLSIRHDRAQAVLRVVDNGIGISPQVLPGIFDLFMQAEVSLDRSQGGLGIGLTLVRRLVESHGGTIEARSRGDNEGSEFTVRLPLVTGVRLVELPAPPEKAPADNDPVPPRRILVVDDNVDSANTSTLLLRLDGHDVKAVYGGLPALDLAPEYKPEIILMDIGLPGMDGYEVARRIRQLPGQDATLIVAISGYVRASEHSSEACFDHHLMKPFDLNELRALISQPERRA